MKTALWGALTLSMIAGCANSMPTSYTLEIESSLSPEQIQATLDAASAWEKAAPGLKLTSYVVSRCHLGGSADSSVICVTMSEDEGEDPMADATTYYQNDVLSVLDVSHTYNADIHIHPGRLSNTIKQFQDCRWIVYNVVLHELGHALGQRGGHEADGKGYLMQPTLHVETDHPAVITETDLEDYYYSAR